MSTREELLQEKKELYWTMREYIVKWGYQNIFEVMDQISDDMNNFERKTMKDNIDFIEKLLTKERK